MRLSLSQGFVALMAATLLVTGQAQAQLWNNGPLSTGPLSRSGVSAPVGSTWSEVQSDLGNTTESNTSAGSAAYRNIANTTNFSLADNFIVGAGDVWTVTSANFWAYRTGNATSPSPFLNAYVQVWGGGAPNAGGTVIWGDLTTNRLTSSVFDNMYRIFNTTTPAPGTAAGTTRPIFLNTVDLTGLTLTGGTYWIEWTYQLTTDTFASFSPNVTIVDSRGLPGWNALQRNGVTNVWTPIIDTGNPAAAPDVAQDVAFRINGTAIPEPATVSLLMLATAAGCFIRRR